MRTRVTCGSPDHKQVTIANDLRGQYRLVDRIEAVALPADPLLDALQLARINPAWGQDRMPVGLPRPDNDVPAV